VVTAAVFVFMATLAFGGTQRAFAEGGALKAGDCAKCHPVPPAEIKAKGGKHRTEVDCMDCHASHRPVSKNNIPACGDCHDGEPHFKLPNCLSCHSNPHQPTVITFGANVTDPCLTCHKGQSEQLQTFKSRHSKKPCSSCHDKHGKIPECVKCHKPHSNGMAQKDCGTCHKAHKPKAVTYAADTGSALCGACHDKALATLQASKTKHSKLECVKCHEAQHKAVPKCAKCHGEPHPASIMAKFPVCGACHKNAHDLNGWGG
jgi:predicted CXXCH cytochrome family protein